jgi:3-dehydroquinate synthetase
VAIGLVGAAEIGRRLGMVGEALVARHERCLRAFGLPTRVSDRECPPLDVERVLDTILLDKKVKGGRVRWVLLERVGKAIVRDDVPRDLVREVVEGLR